MKRFDLIGAAAIALWLGTLGAFVYRDIIIPGQAKVVAPSNKVAISAGESWLILMRGQADVGYMHETRTKIEGGWLVEHDLYTAVELGQRAQVLKAQVKSKVNTEGALQRFSVTYTSALGESNVEGEVKGDHIALTASGDSPQPPNKLPISGEVRLEQMVQNQLARIEGLKANDKLTLNLFDPIGLKMVEHQYRYIDRRPFESYGLNAEVRAFGRQYLGQEQPVFVSDDGELWATRLPLQILASKLPKNLAKARISLIKRQAEKLKGREKTQREQLLAALSKQGLRPEQMSLEQALNMMGQRVETDQAMPAHSWLIEVPQAQLLSALKLSSDRQRVLPQGDQSDHTKLAITTGAPEDDAAAPAPEPLSAQDKAAYLSLGGRIDGQHPSIMKLSEGVDASAGAEAIAKEIGERLRLQLKEEPLTALGLASEALATGRGDCTEYALIMVAALRAAHIPARFVHGVIATKDQGMAPHQWVQYWDERAQRFRELDATRQELSPSPEHIQLMWSADPEAPELLLIMDKLKISAITTAKQETPEP